MGLMVFGAFGIGLIAGFTITALFFRGDACKHDWEPVVERELPSRIEEFKKNGGEVDDLDNEDALLASSKLFFGLVSCKKCGATKEFRAET